MKQINMNELPLYSPWPARLLGSAPWVVPTRDLAKVDAEYDKDKYASCLAFYHEHKNGEVTPDDIKRFEFKDTGPVCVSIEEELALLSRDEAKERYGSLLRETMSSAIAGADTVVELGCGYGFNLWMLSQHFARKNYIGGEYSNNAVELASHLYGTDKQVSRITVEKFDFYNSKYEILSRVPGGKTVVFTSHAIEQLPSAMEVVAGIESCRRPLTVFHFEPVFELHSDSLLGLLRRKYAVANDYNRDLYTLLRNNDRVRVVQVVPDVFGGNPLNATSIIEWEILV